MKAMMRVGRRIALAVMITAVLMAPATSGAVCETEFVSLERAWFGPYGGQAMVVANSHGSWIRAMKALEHSGALAYLPAPEAPEGIDWACDAVILVAAGATGYDVELERKPLGRGKVMVRAKYVPLFDPLDPVDCNHDGEVDSRDDSCQPEPVYIEALPYDLVKMRKHEWLQDMAVQGSAVDEILPLIGSDDSVPAGQATWGRVKVTYR